MKNKYEYIKAKIKADKIRDQSKEVLYSIKKLEQYIYEMLHEIGECTSDPQELETDRLIYFLEIARIFLYTSHAMRDAFHVIFDKSTIAMLNELKTLTEHTIEVANIDMEELVRLSGDDRHKRANKMAFQKFETCDYTTESLKHTLKMAAEGLQKDGN